MDDSLIIETPFRVLKVAIHEDRGDSFLVLLENSFYIINVRRYNTSYLIYFCLKRGMGSVVRYEPFRDSIEDGNLVDCIYLPDSKYIYSFVF